MSFEPRDYLRHIQIEINFLIQTSAGVTLERFLDDATLQRAFVRSIEVIGEAAKHDRLIHGYFGVDYTLVWDVVSTRIPELNEQISSILEA
jgi:uncharacterized protein with HEPN domain